MPVAHCIVAPEVRLDACADPSLVQRWGVHAGEATTHMTINLVQGVLQQGAPYRVMAVLYLPTAWSDEAVQRLQVGLARSLAEGLQCPLETVQVITQRVRSGAVVEGGQTLIW